MTSADVQVSLLDTALLCVWRAAVTGVAFVALPTIATWSRPGVLFYSVPLAALMGGAMGAFCAPILWLVLRRGRGLVWTVLAAATAAAVLWMGLVAATFVGSSSRMTNAWWLFMFVPAAVGACAAGWTVWTLRTRERWRGTASN